MNGKQAKAARRMAGHVVSANTTPYMVTPGSQERKSFTVGIDMFGKEIKQYFNTATFQMEDCPRLMAKHLKKVAQRIKNGTPGIKKPKKGEFKSRKGKPTVILGNGILYPKPMR